MVFSKSIEEDTKYGLGLILNLIDLKSYISKNIDYWVRYLKLKIIRDKYALDLFPYQQAIKEYCLKQKCVALSVGGDNYCYGGTGYFYSLDSLLHSYGIPTVMVGCSIEEDVIKDPLTNKDLKNHSLIIARESITYNNLLANGIERVSLYPDPAFALPIRSIRLPEGFEEDNTIGINLSPWVERCGNGDKMIYRNAQKLIEYIISSTGYKIALVPHVVWDHSSDYDFLAILYDEYKHTDRIILVDDMDAESLKYIISKCKLFLTARTHASIAAYSTCVPTVVIGYSVKAIGIARDIFGTEENYVLPTQNITSENEMVDSFKWLSDNEYSIRNYLQSFMPSYISRTKGIKSEIYKLIG